MKKTTISNKKDIAMSVATAIMFGGVRSVVEPAVKMITPEETSLKKRMLAKIGAATISAAVTRAVSKQIDGALDDIISCYEIVKSMSDKEVEDDGQETNGGETE